MNRTDRRTHERAVKRKLAQLKEVSHRLRLQGGTPSDLARLQSIRDDLVRMGVFRKITPLERIMMKTKRIFRGLKFWQ